MRRASAQPSFANWTAAELAEETHAEQRGRELAGLGDSGAHTADHDVLDRDAVERDEGDAGNAVGSGDAMREVRIGIHYESIAFITLGCDADEEPFNRYSVVPPANWPA